MQHLATSAVEQMRGALDECADVALWSLPDAQVEDLVAQAHALVARIEGTLLLPLIREADRRGLAKASQAPSTTVWLRWLLRVRPAEARGLVRLAHAVEAEVQAVGLALAAGEINRAHA